MDIELKEIDQRKEWVEPKIVDLNVNDTFALPNRGADVGGNPFVDCQRS